MWSRFTEITEPYIKIIPLVTLWDHESVNINYSRQFDQYRSTCFVSVRLFSSVLNGIKAISGKHFMIY